MVKNREKGEDISRRSNLQEAFDFLTFPIRTVMPFRVGERSKFGLSSRASERFDYAAREVEGYTLDIGCGPYDRFVREYLGGNGMGVDIFQFDGLKKEQVFPDLTSFPFEDDSFDSATLIATLHHIPRSKRDEELAEIYRVLKPGGNVIVTNTLPLATFAVHRVTRLHAKLLGKVYDMDLLREMDEEEEDYITQMEVVERMARAGFRNITRKLFLSQWGMNRLFVGWKK